MAFGFGELFGLGDLFSSGLGDLGASLSQSLGNLAGDLGDLFSPSASEAAGAVDESGFGLPIKTPAGVIDPGQTQILGPEGLPILTDERGAAGVRLTPQGTPLPGGALSATDIAKGVGLTGGDVSLGAAGKAATTGSGLETSLNALSLLGGGLGGGGGPAGGGAGTSASGFAGASPISQAGGATPAQLAALSAFANTPHRGLTPIFNARVLGKRAIPFGVDPDFILTGSEGGNA